MTVAELRSNRSHEPGERQSRVGRKVTDDLNLDDRETVKALVSVGLPLAADHALENLEVRNPFKSCH